MFLKIVRASYFGLDAKMAIILIKNGAWLHGYNDYSRFVLKSSDVLEKIGSVGGVSGLYLSISLPNSKYWILRTKIGNKRSDIGFGSYRAISLSLAQSRSTTTKEIKFSLVVSLTADAPRRSRRTYPLPLTLVFYTDHQIASMKRFI